jgi:hypothetical protein
MTKKQPVPQAPEPDKTVTVLHDVDLQLCDLVKKLQLRIRAPIEDDAVRAGRLRIILSLYDVAVFFDAIGAGQDVANHFVDLATLFDDLNRGARRPPLLVPAPSRGNRPEVSILWEVRGIVALGVDILVRSGMIEDDACSAAAAYHGLNRLLTKCDSSLKTSIKSWYKLVKQADAGGAPVNLKMLQAFRQSQRWEGVAPGSACEQSGRVVLQDAAKRAKNLPAIRLPPKA